MRGAAGLHRGQQQLTGRRRADMLGVALLMLLATALMSSGCTPWREYFGNGFKVGPNYRQPPAPVAEQWIDETDKRISTDEPDLSHWWTTFNDSDLNELVHSAYQQNLTLKEAGYRILEARAALAIQVGNLFPQTQQAIGGYSRNAISTLAANQNFLPQRFFDSWDLGFNLAWELDFWGRFRREIESAADVLDASVFNYDDVIVTLLGDVGSTYVEMRTLQQQLQYVHDNIAIQTESLDIAQARYRGGLTSELDVQQATSTLAQTEALIPQLSKQLRAANDRLCVLLGIPTRDLTKCLGDKPIPGASPDVVVGIPCDLLTRRPDIRRAEREAAAQCAQIGVAESELYPQIAITGTFVFDSERFTDLFKNKSQQGTVGPGFQWNVLNYGRLVNNIRVQDAKFKELVLAYQNTVLQANSEVEDGLAEFLESQLQAKAMQRSVDAADKAVKLSIVQYRGGLVDFNRVALLQQNLVQQQDLLAQAQGDIALGLIRTYRALGGGWQVRCTGFGPAEAAAAVGGTNPSGETIPPGTPAPSGQRPDPNSQPLQPQRGLPLEGPSGPLPPGEAPGEATVPSAHNNMPGGTTWDSTFWSGYAQPKTFSLQDDVKPVASAAALPAAPAQQRFTPGLPSAFSDPKSVDVLRGVLSAYPSNAEPPTSDKSGSAPLQ